MANTSDTKMSKDTVVNEFQAKPYTTSVKETVKETVKEVTPVATNTATEDKLIKIYNTKSWDLDFKFSGSTAFVAPKSFSNVFRLSELEQPLRNGLMIYYM